MSDENNQSATLSEETISFRNSNHGNVLSEKMFKYFKDQTFCDIIIKGDLFTSDNEICAHRLVLSSHSEYFSNIFTGGTQYYHSELIIDNISEEMLRRIVEYCYTGRLEVENNKDRVKELLNKARYFQIKFLEESCIKWLTNHSVLSTFEVYGLYPLEEYSAQLGGKGFGDICKNFMELYKTDEFLKLSADKLANLIAQDHIKVKSEEDIVDALLTWLNYNFDERQQYIGYLLPLIRFPFLQPTYISRHLKAICRSNENLKLMLEALEWHNVPENREVETLHWICTKKRQFNSLIMIIGHEYETHTAKFFEIYDPVENKSFHCYIMPQGKTSFRNIAATVMDDELIVAGGYHIDTTLNTVYKLNLTTLTWSQLPSMLITRKSFKLIAFQHKIYTVGGMPPTNTVECWNPTTNVWKFVSEMSKKRYEHCVIELDNKLYALGGRQGFSALSSVECYDAKLDKWTTKASMIKERMSFTVGILYNFLYAIGGDTPGNTVERYDAKANKWILLHTIDVKFNWLTCISLQNDLICTAYVENLMKIIKYDPLTNEIITLHTLKNQRWNHAVLAIPHIMLKISQ